MENKISESIHRLVVYTNGRKPILTETIAPLVDQALSNIPAHHPGLRVLEHQILPDRVEMTLDLQRLDEDLARILQLFKAEAKSRAKTGGFKEEHLWQWGYEEK